MPPAQLHTAEPVAGAACPLVRAAAALGDPAVIAARGVLAPGQASCPAARRERRHDRRRPRPGAGLRRRRVAGVPVQARRQKAPDTARTVSKDARPPTRPSSGHGGRPGRTRNVAIATGAPGPDVLDVDVKPDGSGFAAFNRLKQAGLLTGARALVRTPTRRPARLLRRAPASRAGACRGTSSTSRPPAGTCSPRRPRSAAGRTSCSTTAAALTAGSTGRPSGGCSTRPGRAPRPGRERRCRRSGGVGRRAQPKATGTPACTGPRAAWSRPDSPSGGLEQLVAAAVQAGLPEDEARRTVASAARKAAG